MTRKIAIVTHIAEYGGPAALDALVRDGFTIVCHHPDFVDVASRIAFEDRSTDLIACASQEPEDLVQMALDRFDRVDVVVANYVGKSMKGMIEERTVHDFRAIFDCYAINPLRLISAAVPTMKKQGGGRIILVTSGAPLSPRTNMAAFSAAQAAANNVVATLGAELGGSGIAINAIAPIYLLSHYFPGGMTVPAYADLVKTAIPMQRFGEPSEFGELVSLLASGRADFISGQVIGFSGGGV